MDFELNADQKLIVDSVAAFVKKELPLERTRKLREDDVGYSREAYRQMGELGWLGIMHPESVGGFGGRFVDAALVLEQLGAGLVPEPYAASAVVAGSALSLAGTAAQQETYLTPALSGDTTLAFAWAEAGGRFDATSCATRAEKTAGGYRVRGKKVWVENGHAADCLVVTARTGGRDGEAAGMSLFLVEANEVRRTHVKCMDGRRAAMVELDCELPAERLLGEAGEAGDTIALVLDRGAAAACAEGYGVMKTALALTVDYLKTRDQFGVKIGTFQVLQHRAVDMFIEAELSRSVMLLAALKCDEPDAVERQRAISVAKAQVAASGRYVTQQAIQLHGGIGITDEADIGLYFKRMHVLGTVFGDEEHHVRRFAALPSFAAAL